MRRLLLLRHAKTERTHPDGDHARRLTERGRTDAALMGAWLAARRLTPDLALVSDAQRTRETFAHVAAALAPPPQARFERALYHADPRAMLTLIGATDDAVATLLVIAHNPGIHELAFALAQGERSPQAQQLSLGMPTCALALYEVRDDPHIAWSDLAPGALRLSAFVTAKSLRQAAGLPGPDDAD